MVGIVEVIVWIHYLSYVGLVRLRDQISNEFSVIKLDIRVANFISKEILLYYNVKYFTFNYSFTLKFLTIFFFSVQWFLVFFSIFKFRFAILSFLNINQDSILVLNFSNLIRLFLIIKFLNFLYNQNNLGVQNDD